jgi:hypothetical protein
VVKKEGELFLFRDALATRLLEGLVNPEYVLRKMCCPTWAKISIHTLNKFPLL